MDTGKLKKFAQAARRELIQQIAGKLKQILAEGSLARREQAAAVVDLERQIQAHGRDEVIERAAYTWFNRFAALRFMDAHRYNRIMTVSPAEEQTQPEILAEAKQGHIDEGVVPEKVRERVFALLDGRTPSRDAQGEAYRLLLVAVCNYWHHAMPFLFERIADWTELLMPDDLMSDSSVRTRIRTVLSADDCQDVEVIGWLYQFYISEKKDEVFAGLKKGKKISAENIPAATQLFTPHWIVRYLVENSLGRLWQLNRPNSRLAERMDYYIAPEEPETDFLKINKPEEIKLCDPACGSGHMLTYAFDVLYAIYEEEGYAPDDIPVLILEHNLTGIEIDERAGALAAFALAMKSAEKLGRRKFLKLAAQPTIVVLQDVRFSEDELKDYMAEMGRDLFTADLRETLGQFEQAKNFGSLIQPALKDPSEVRRVLSMKEFEANLFLIGTHRKVLETLRMAEVLTSRCHVVVTNPPYMGGKGMNKLLSDWLKKNYFESKSDLMTCFMDRAESLCFKWGFWGMINLPAWLFLSSFEGMRSRLIKRNTISSLIHLGRGIFGSDFGSVAFTIHNESSDSQYKGIYRRLFDKHVSVRTPEVIRNLFLQQDYGSFSASASDFQKIPGTPIAYWVTDNFRNAFDVFGPLSTDIVFRQGMSTTDPVNFERQWQEVAQNKLNLSRTEAFLERDSQAYWHPFNKGGEFRKWYGNQLTIVRYEKNGEVLLDLVKNKYPNISDPEFVIKNRSFFFREFISYSSFTSSAFSAKYVPAGFAFSVAGSAIFTNEWDKRVVLGFLCSRSMNAFAAAINPTFGFQISDIARVPFDTVIFQLTRGKIEGLVSCCIDISGSDWDAYETSWDFTTLPLLSPDHHADTLDATYTHLRNHWHEITKEMQHLEEENNRIFIDAYGLHDELNPVVPVEEITLTCNPAYRYGVKISKDEREKRLLADTMAEFLSYAVGCMVGRYSLDKPGLLLANQGETLADYLAQVPEPSFLPDEDNVVPILDADWFTDDITERFRDFLRLTFGAEHFQENVEFIEQALGKPIRKYFLKDFYKNHVQRYKKRPIYWLFSSPKGSFNALIYLHRYRPDTVSVILNEYLREFITKLGARIQQLEQIEASTSSSARDKTTALKEITKLRDTIAELEEWERKVMLPLASERIEIDLDDGVKANYPKFGSALAKIPGLSA